MTDYESQLKEETDTFALTCKKCGSDRVIKSGIVAGRQRFRCKDCGCNFRVGDNRTNETIATKRLLCVLLHFMTKASFRTLGKLLQTDHALVYRWIQTFNENMTKSPNSREIAQMNIQELQQFIDTKKETWTTKQLTVIDGELWPECTATVILQLSENPTTNNET